MPPITLLSYCWEYSQASGGKFILKTDESKGYITLNTLLEYIRSNIEQTLNLFITPHIFTKFINLLKVRNIDNNNYKKILDLFKEEFNYIKEEEIKKEDVIDFSNFRNQIIGVSETVLLLLKERKKEPCILSSNPKILEGFKSDFLYVDFKEMVTFIENLKRKSE